MTRRRLITRRELAAELDVHPMTITKWEREGLPVAEVGRKGRSSLYSLAESRKWIKARELEAKKNAAGGTVVDLTRERARKEHAQALVQEQTLAIRARELVPRAEIEETWSKEVAAVRAKLLSWPATLSAQIHRAAELGGVPAVEKILNEAVEELLHELSAPGPRKARKSPPRKRASSKKKKKPKVSSSRKKAPAKKSSSRKGRK